MKFAYLMLIFTSLWYDCGAMNEVNACMERKYETYNNYKISKKFGDEYSIFTNGMQKLFGNPKVPSQKEKDNLKELCGCVFLKFIQKDDPNLVPDLEHFEQFLPDITTEDFPIKFCVSYYFFDITVTFPAHICEFEGQKLMMVKGSKKRSPQNEVYNIYVGTLVTKKDQKVTYNLEGIIDNVDVELPAFGVPQQIQES